MQTIFDWVSLVAFAGLVVLFLQRSMDGEGMDKIWLYLPPSLGCVAANWLGNKGYPLLSVAVLMFSLVYVVYVLKPKLFKR